MRSTDGPEATAISGQGLPEWPDGPSNPTIRFISGEEQSSVLDGFSIKDLIGPYGSWSSAIWCEDATPTIRGCVVGPNDYATGIRGSAYIEDCIIRFNYGYDNAGGGVYGARSIINSTIENNNGYHGGGIYAIGTVIRSCVVRNNNAWGGVGGGIASAGGNVIESCLVYDNSIWDAATNGKGGGAHLASSDVVDRCIVIGNSIDSYYGGASGLHGAGTVTNTIVRDNVSLGFPTPEVSDSILVTYSNVAGGYPGTGNIDANPLFYDPANDDYRLLPDSLCIDAGDPLGDLDPDFTVADMGALPFNQFPNCEGAQVAVSAGGAFDHIGSSVECGGPYALVGLSDVDGVGFDSGKVSIIYRDGPDWVELPAELTASDPAVDAFFGHSIAGDGQAILVGARGVSAETGAAYLFKQQSDGTWDEEIKLQAADGMPGDWFGSRVAIEGDLALVAAVNAAEAGADSGAVYFYRENGGLWSQEDKVVGLDTAAGDHFGKGLFLSGARALVGAYADADAGQDSGSAYVLRDDGGAWVQEDKLTASDASPGDLFGNEVALEGDLAVVAARGAGGIGAVYVFERSGANWNEVQKLTASTPFANAEFGSAVALAGNRILVGAKNDDSAADDGGAAYLFEFDGLAWVETAKYTLPEAAFKDQLGSSVALSGDYALVGAEWADDPELDSGELWAFPLPGTCSPKIMEVGATLAQFPGKVVATGMFLDQTQQVLVDGVPASLVGATETSVTYVPQPGVPGHLPLEAIGLDGTATGTQQLYPSLETATTGIGGTVDVVIDNGDEGLYALAFATGVWPVPIPIASPPTWYGALLDLTGPLFTLGSGAFATSDSASLSYPVPDNPALSGLQLYFQAWCQQGFFGVEVTHSFTNVGAIVL